MSQVCDLMSFDGKNQAIVNDQSLPNDDNFNSCRSGGDGFAWSLIFMLRLGLKYIVQKT